MGNRQNVYHVSIFITLFPCIINFLFSNPLFTVAMWNSLSFTAFILLKDIFTKYSPFSCIFVGQDEQHEIQRQNRITEQILTNYFERKFFPNRKPKPAPTIDEILPPESRASIRDKHSAQREDDDEPDTDNLQSVESEHVDSFYRDYTEGRWKFLKFFGW